jgi:hypothetical protein
MGNDFALTYHKRIGAMRTVQLRVGDVAIKHHRPIKLISRVTRLPSGFLVLWLVACEHAGSPGLGRPLPAHLPPATPPLTEAPAALPRTESSGSSIPLAFALSEQAERFLVLQYRAFHTEFMGCMIGAVRGDTLVVERIAPADVDPVHSAATWVVPTQTCERAGWGGVVGTIHSHVAGLRCWYFFPGTRVPSADAEMFTRSTYTADAIMCGDRVVWIDRRLEQHQVTLALPAVDPR